MKKYHIPTANYMAFNSFDEAVAGLDEFSYPLVIKADGLCLGKGVEICNTREEAVKVLEDVMVKEKFGREGKTVVIEEYLDGVEASLLCFVTENRFIPMESAKDYKKIYEGDLGPNTGGVGCISPSPLFTEELKEKVEKEIIERIQYGLESEGMKYKGILYIGLMIVKGEPKVLEFNVRFGDPETEVLIPRLDTDLVELFERTIDGTLAPCHVRWKKESCLTVVLTSKGYPMAYKKGYEIIGLDNLDGDIILFHNGTRYKDRKLVTDGGRVLSVTALAGTLEEAREKVYSNTDRIRFEGAYFRKDIGKL